MANKKSERIADNLFVRDLEQEKVFGIKDLKLYGYWEDNSSLNIVGQIVADKLKSECCFICSIYDHDGDVMESCENEEYGSGLVSSMIHPEAFFNGFPFRFDLYSVKKKRVKAIKIVPADSY